MPSMMRGMAGRRARRRLILKVGDESSAPGRSVLPGPDEGGTMGKVIASITTSVDGYVTGPDDGPEYGLGKGGERLHYWVMGQCRCLSAANYRGMECEHLGGHPAGRPADLACCAEGVLRG